MNAEQELHYALERAHADVENAERVITTAQRALEHAHDRVRTLEAQQARYAASALPVSMDEP